VAGAHVVLVEGEPVVYLERGGKGLVTLPAFADAATATRALAALGGLVADGRLREVVVARVDGVPVGSSPHRQALLDAGFVPGYRGLALRGGAPPTPTPVSRAAG